MKRPELMITNGELSGRRFAVGEGGLRLGRSSSNDIHLTDEQLSRNHCLFETVGDSDVRVTDLASANGTYLNGRPLEGDPAVLKVGDLVEVGTTVIRIVGDREPVAQGAVDLGLGDAGRKTSEPRRRSPLANVLWALAVLAALAAIGLVLVVPQSEPVTAQVEQASEDPVLREASYEKVEADANGIFRYVMTLSAEGVLTVTVDDVPRESRHLTKSAPLGEKSLAEIREILAWQSVHALDREYAGAESDASSLNSWTLRAVYSTRARSVSVVNTQEPAAFRQIREKLEAFSKNELGIWALQYSREKLVSLAEESIALAQSKWDERDVQHGNLYAASVAYQEAIFYLETVNPKPDCIRAARQGLEESRKALEQRYADQRFLADRAIKLGQWDVAQKELAVLVEMIPDRNDNRNREATAKLLDVEKRMKGSK